MSTIPIPFNRVRLGEPFISEGRFLVRTDEPDELRAHKADGSYWYPAYEDVQVKVLSDGHLRD